MPTARSELGRALTLNASAVGPPGQRHFRLTVEAERGKACFWLEKEQLFNLAMAAKWLLAMGSPPEPPSPAPVPESESSQELEFQVGELTLDLGEDGGLFRLVAKELEEEGGGPTADLLATARQLGSMADEALEVCAAGRPRCPLCGAPIESEQHVCARSNGHVASQIE